MLILALDTSSPTGTIALRDEKRIIGLYTVSVDMTHSEGLMPAMDELLARAGKRIDDVTHVACVSGPGSYTGLRIGIASAQGIASARGLPCFQATSLEMLAWSMPHSRYPLCPLLPARKGWLYARLFSWDQGSPSPSSEEMNIEIDDLISRIQEPTVLYGPGFPPNKEALSGILGDDLILVGAEAHNPRADCLAEMAHRGFISGNALTASELAPHYLGPSQAEVNWKKRRGK